MLLSKGTIQCSQSFLFNKGKLVSKYNFQDVKNMTPIQMQDGLVSKLSFNSLMNKAICKMAKLVQKSI